MVGCAGGPVGSTESTPSSVQAAILTEGLEAVSRSLPIYPPELYRQGIAGAVKVEVQMDRSGQVTMAQVVESTERQFEVPAIKGALKWRFKRGPERGELRFEFSSPISPSGVRSKAPVESGSDLISEPSTAGPYSIDQVDVKPRITVSVPPAYPVGFFKGRVAGRVMVKFVIDETGVPVHIVAEQATNADFAAAAIAAVKAWRYVPAGKEGKPVACLAHRTIDFIPGD